MGRTASIEKNDVAEARAELIAAKQPHGIIAIRKVIGRGSPQLIARFVKQIESESGTSNHRSALPDPIQRSVEQVWESVWQQVAAQIEDVEKTAQVGLSQRDSQCQALTEQVARLESEISAHQGSIAELQQQLRSLERANGHSAAKLEASESRNQQLEQQLMQQRDLFESWRTEQLNERLMLKAQLDTLVAAGKRSTQPRPTRRGEQLDLYRKDDD